MRPHHRREAQVEGSAPGSPDGPIGKGKGESRNDQERGEPYEPPQRSPHSSSATPYRYQNTKPLRLTLTGRHEMARRDRRRPVDRPTAHRGHPQVIKIQAASAPDESAIWRVQKKPAEQLRVGETVFVQLLSDPEQRGLEEPMTIVSIVGSPVREGSAETETLLHVISSEKVHAPITISAPSQWVDTRNNPTRVTNAVRAWKRREGVRSESAREAPPGGQT